MLLDGLPYTESTCVDFMRGASHARGRWFEPSRDHSLSSQIRGIIALIFNPFGLSKGYVEFVARVAVIAKRPPHALASSGVHPSVSGCQQAPTRYQRGTVSAVGERRVTTNPINSD